MIFITDTTKVYKKKKQINFNKITLGIGSSIFTLMIFNFADTQFWKISREFNFADFSRNREIREIFFPRKYLPLRYLD